MKVKVAQSCLTLCDPMNCSRQAPLSMEFSRPDYYQKTSPCHLAILIVAYTATDLLSMFSGVLILGKLLNGRAAFLHCYNGEGASTSQVLRVSVLVSQSCLTLATPWTVARQVPLSIGFSRQEHWSRLHFLPQWTSPA